MNITNEYIEEESIIVVNKWIGMEPHATPPEFIDDEGSKGLLTVLLLSVYLLR